MFIAELTTYGQSVASSQVTIDGIILISEYVNNIDSVDISQAVLDIDACGNINNNSGSVRVVDTSSNVYAIRTILFYTLSGSAKKVVAGYSQEESFVLKTAGVLNILLPFDFSVFTNGFLFATIQSGYSNAAHNTDGVLHIENPDTSADDNYSVYSKTQVDDLISDVSYTAGDGISLSDNIVRTTGIPFGICDDTSTATKFTVTVPGIYKLEDGVTCMVKNGVVTSDSGFTLNVNGLGAKPCYTNLAAATRETTIFNVAYTMLFVYDSTRVLGGCWICYRGYDSDTNSVGYRLRTNSTVMSVSDTARYYKLYFTSANGNLWVPASVNSTSDTTTARAVNQRPINPFGRIVYTSADTNYTVGANLAATTIWDQYNLALGYSFNVNGGTLALTAEKPVYVKCAPQTDGSAIIDATNPTVQDLPTSSDGKIYIFLGTATSATAVELFQNHPVYYHDGSGIKLWSGAVLPSKTSDLTNDSGFITEEDIPTNVSAFNNDVGYLTSYTETDPTVPSWAKESTKPSYTLDDVADGSTRAIPTKTTARSDGKYLYNGQAVDAMIGNFGISNSADLLNTSGVTSYVAVRSDASNPLIGLKCGTNLWYCQASQDKFYFGPTSAKALMMDQHGNGTFRSGTCTATGFVYQNGSTAGTSSDVLLADGTISKLKTVNDESIFGTGNISVSGGEGDVNVIESISINNTAQPITNKNVNLTQPITIDGVSFNTSANLLHYTTCTTAASTVAKVVDLEGFTLVEGARVTVKFSATNSASDPTLNVNGTGAKAIKYRGTAAVTSSNSYKWQAGNIIDFIYDGTNWLMVGWQTYANYSTIASYATYIGNSSANYVACSNNTASNGKALLPFADASDSTHYVDLGSATKRWRTAYIKNSIQLADSSAYIVGQTNLLRLLAQDDSNIWTSVIVDIEKTYFKVYSYTGTTSEDSIKHSLIMARSSDISLYDNHVNIASTETTFNKSVDLILAKDTNTYIYAGNELIDDDYRYWWTIYDKESMNYTGIGISMTEEASADSTLIVPIDELSSVTPFGKLIVNTTSSSLSIGTTSVTDSLKSLIESDRINTVEDYVFLCFDSSNFPSNTIGVVICAELIDQGQSDYERLMFFIPSDDLELVGYQPNPSLGSYFIINSLGSYSFSNDYNFNYRIIAKTSIKEYVDDKIESRIDQGVTYSTYASQVGIRGANNNTSYPLLFTSPVPSSVYDPVYKNIYTDTSNDLYYNPYTNTLACTTFSGSLSGNATSATYTSNIGTNSVNSVAKYTYNHATSRALIPTVDYSSSAYVNLGNTSNKWGYIYGTYLGNASNYFTSAHITTVNGTTFTGNAATATKATQDASGNTITSYYCTLSTEQDITGIKHIKPTGCNYSFDIGRLETVSGIKEATIQPVTSCHCFIGTSSNNFRAVYATTFYGALSGNATSATNATNATKVYVNTSSSNMDYPLVFNYSDGSTVNPISGYKELRMDSTGSACTYNPYTNVLTCTTISATNYTGLGACLGGGTGVDGSLARNGAGGFCLLVLDITATSNGSIARGSLLSSNSSVTVNGCYYANMWCNTSTIPYSTPSLANAMCCDTNPANSTVSSAYRLLSTLYYTSGTFKYIVPVVRVK